MHSSVSSSLQERLLPEANARAIASLSSSIRNTFFYMAREAVDSMNLSILIVLALQTYTPQWLDQSSCANGDDYGHDRLLMVFLGVFLFDILGLRNIPAAKWEDYITRSEASSFWQKLTEMKRADWASLKPISTTHRAISAYRLGGYYPQLNAFTTESVAIACYPLMKFVWQKILTALENTSFTPDRRYAIKFQEMMKQWTEKKFVREVGRIIDTVLDPIGQGIRSASAFHLFSDTLINYFIEGSADDDAPYQNAINIFMLTMVIIGLVIGIVANLATKFLTSSLKDSQKQVQAFEQAMAIFVATMVTLMGVGVCATSAKLLSPNYYRETGYGLASMSSALGLATGVVAWTGIMDKPKQAEIREKICAMLENATASHPDESRWHKVLRWSATRFCNYIGWLHNPTQPRPEVGSMPLKTMNE